RQPSLVSIAYRGSSLRAQAGSHIRQEARALELLELLRRPGITQCIEVGLLLVLGRRGHVRRIGGFTLLDEVLEGVEGTADGLLGVSQGTCSLRGLSTDDGAPGDGGGHYWIPFRLM